MADRGEGRKGQNTPCFLPTLHYHDTHLVLLEQELKMHAREFLMLSPTHTLHLDKCLLCIPYAGLPALKREDLRVGPKLGNPKQSKKLSLPGVGVLTQLWQSQHPSPTPSWGPHSARLSFMSSWLWCAKLFDFSGSLIPYLFWFSHGLKYSSHFLRDEPRFEEVKWLDQEHSTRQ